MRILNIMLAKARGGIETMAARYHEALCAGGHAVLSLGHPQGVLPGILGEGAFAPVMARVNHDPLAAFALARHIRTFRPDLILAHGNRAIGLCLLSGRAARDRTVPVMHNDFIKPHLKHARTVICVSRNVRDAVTARYPALDTVVVENFLKLDIRPMRQHLPVIPRIGALGRLHCQKGFDLLLEAAAQLHRAGTPVHIDIAGDGPEAQRLQGQRDRLGLDRHVTFHGWVSPVADFLDRLDMLVVPSRYEPFGLVVIEALAAGTPVIACDVEGPNEILQGGAFGMLFRTGDASALAQAIGHALAAPEQTRLRTALGQTHVSETYGFAAGRTRLQAAVERAACRPIHLEGDSRIGRQAARGFGGDTGSPPP